MKTTGKLIIFIFTFLALAASAYAQSPREELQQMVEQLQKSPGDNALREKIIRLAPTLKPSPALPDAAITFEGRAQFAFKSAKSEDDFLAAAHEYEKAVAAAPWVPGYYTDLCTIYEKAGKFEDAKRHCGFYLIGLTDPAQMTDVKRRIAGLEFGIEKVAADKRRAAEVANSPQAKEAALLSKVEGARFVDRVTSAKFSLQPGTWEWDEIFEIKDRELYIKFKIYAGRRPVPPVGPIPYRDGAFTETLEDGTTRALRIRPDGQALIRPDHTWRNGSFKAGEEIPRD